MSKKIDINRVLRGEVKTVPDIDFNSPENQKAFKKAREESKSILRRKNVNWHRLGSAVISK